MKLYNTLTKTTEEVKPLEGNTLRIYTCGPTVYDHAHIGNLSNYIYADTLRRVAGLAGFDIKQAMNYTDVDDKTIRRSKERFPKDDPKVALQKLTDEYIELFLGDMEKVGNDIDALHFMRATSPEVIKGMQELITKLHEKGFAYIADDGVYFSIKAYRESGKTYGQFLELAFEDDDTSKERIQNDEYDKESVHDFALWKKRKDTEPAWDFKLDGHKLNGRPGWHIECSVMSRQALGQPFDIHTGGVDLIFPHHENEIAQSTACEINPTMARLFAHSEHILVDGKKMAKSANNFYTLHDVVEKGYDPMAFRLLVLQSSYRNQVHFSWENLAAAQARLKRFQNLAARQHQGKSAKPNDSAMLPDPNVTILPALEDDLDTPRALAAVEDFIDQVEGKNLADGNLRPFLQLLDKAFGLRLSSVADIPDDLKHTIAARESARSAKDWDKADSIRKDLEEQGIGVNDTETGPIWYRL